MNSDVIRILNVLLGIGCPNYDSIRYILTAYFLILQFLSSIDLKWPGVYLLSMRRCSTSQFQYSDRHSLLKITGASTPGNAKNPTSPHNFKL